MNIHLEPAVKACSRKLECRRKLCLQTGKPYLYAPPTSVRVRAIMPLRVKAPDCRKLMWARAQRAQMIGHHFFGDLSGYCEDVGLPDKTMQPAYTTRPRTADTWGDFAALVEANNAVWGGCWCMGFHPEGVGKGSTVSQNREGQTRARKQGNGPPGPCL